MRKVRAPLTSEQRAAQCPTDVTAVDEASEATFKWITTVKIIITKVNFFLVYTDKVSPQCFGDTCPHMICGFLPMHVNPLPVNPLLHIQT